jgi:hypothetical protein
MGAFSSNGIQYDCPDALGIRLHIFGVRQRLLVMRQRIFGMCGKKPVEVEDGFSLFLCISAFKI